MDTRILHRLEPSAARHSEIRVCQALPFRRNDAGGRILAETLRDYGSPLSRLRGAPSAIWVSGKNPHGNRARHPDSQTERQGTAGSEFPGPGNPAAVRIQEARRHVELCEPVPEALLSQFHPELLRRVVT